MAKRWFGFSDRVLAGVVNSAFVCGALVAQMTVMAPAFAIEGTTTSPAYPFVDLIAKTKPGAIQVGDKIEVQISENIAGGLGPDLSLGVPASGADVAFDQGFNLGPGLLISPLKAGDLSLPSLELKNKSGQIVARTNPLAIKVESGISAKDPKPQEPAELRPPVAVPVPLYLRVLFWVLLATLGVTLAILTWRWISKRRRKPAFVEPERPEDQRALAALEGLVAQGHLERGEHKLHYFKLSEILKKYLGERFDFDAPESTTYELTEKLNEKLRGEKSVDLIQVFFDGIDRIKFTDYVPEKVENQQRLQEAREIITVTKKSIPVLVPALATEVRP